LYHKDGMLYTTFKGLTEIFVCRIFEPEK